jgi:hypothetical protein
MAPAIEHIAGVHDMRALFEGLPSVLARRHDAAQRVDGAETHSAFSFG